MSNVRFLQLDVFSARPGGGNPLGVVFGAEHWDAERMQRFATWTRLVETTFVLPPTTPEASYRLRIFTPFKEIAFAGHPSIGSALAVLETGFASDIDGFVHQQCDAGVLPLRIDQRAGTGTDLYLRTPPAHVLRDGEAARTALQPLLEGHALGSLGAALVDGGRRWWLAELADEEQLRGWRPDHDSIATLARATESMGLCLFARGTGTHGYDLAVRAYPAGANIVEDPASGAANGLIAAWIAQCEPDGSLGTGYRVSQGREIGHDARLVLRVDDGHVWVGGSAEIVIDGQLCWPQESLQPASRPVRATG